jgi:hypothetical protein
MNNWSVINPYGSITAITVMEPPWHYHFFSYLRSILRSTSLNLRLVRRSKNWSKTRYCQSPFLFWRNFPEKLQRTHISASNAEKHQTYS